MIICTQPAEHSSSRSRRDKEQRQRERRRVERAGKGERGQSYKCIAPKNRLTNTRMTTNDAEREREKDREGMCVEKDIDCVRAEGGAVGGRWRRRHAKPKRNHKLKLMTLARRS